MVPRPDIAQLAADGPAVFDHDDRVHALRLDFQPTAAVPHERLEVRRGVEVVRYAAVPVADADERIGGARPASRL